MVKITAAARRQALRLAALTSVIVLSGCERNEPATGPAAAVSQPLAPGIEGEFFGNVYVNGARTQDAGYRVKLVPFDPPTWNRLRSYSDSMWADTTAAHWMYEWSDPKAGGKCGNLARYLEPDTMAPPNQGGRHPEAHRPAPNIAPTGVEKHCIRPGRYEFILKRGPIVVRRFLVGYLPITPANRGQINVKLVWNQTAVLNEALEDLNYDDTTNVWSDLVVHVDTTVGGSEVRVLDVDNAGANPTAKDTFVNASNPGGTEADYFRISVARSTSTWALEPTGRGLSRLFWDYGRNNLNRTGFYDSYPIPTIARPILRSRRLGDSIVTSRDDTVALELMRPSEQPDSLTVTKRVVQVVRNTPFACSTFESITTWRTSDQYLSAGCSTQGSNIQYRWRYDVGGAWTSYSSDTLHDFPGHTTSGIRQVSLEVRNTSTGLSSFRTTPVTVQSGQVTLTGDAEITVKTTYTYTSNHYGTWYERFNPGLTWYQGTTSTAMNRVWAAGVYTVELRQQDTMSSVYRRGRLSISVCIPVSSCGPAVVLEGSAPAAAVADTAWSLFGGGPWLSWGSGGGAQALRLYDLLGEHDGGTPFTSATWLADSAGSHLTLPASWTLEWQRRTLDLPDAQAFDVTIGGGSGPYTFGFALDPDVGPNAADDVSAYDAARGLVTARDGAQAVGYLLRGPSGNALASIQQYGVGRWAPSTPAAARQAQRQTGTRLLAGPRDVQFVLSAAETTGLATYTLVIVRGRTVPDLQAKADAAIAALGR